MAPDHPAKYTDSLLPVFAKMLYGSKRVLDPFAGTGKIFRLSDFLPDTEIRAIEIEPEWAALDSRTVIGNALFLPWSDSCFDAVCTSPTYGNRMADHHVARDSSKRMTYSHVLGRQLHSDNSGRMQFGNQYKEFHVEAWTEVRRVLVTGGKFVLNIKDHIRKGIVVPVTEWHIEIIQSLGFVVSDHVYVECPGARYGRNYARRVDYESVILFILDRGQ